MKKFREFVTEVFDSSYPYKLKYDYDGATSYNITTKNDVIAAIFSSSDFENFDFGFIRRGAGFGFDLSGDADAFKVMATIMKIMKEFISKHKQVKSISFSASKTEKSKKTGRASLYKKMIQKFTPKGWTSKITSDSKTKMEFQLIKKVK